MRVVVLLVILFAIVTIACGAGDEVPTLAATAAIQEAAPPATATDTPGAEEGPTNTPKSTDSPNPTDTPTIQIMCTAPACNADEIYFCPDDCPGSCGTICMTVTPSIPPGQEAQVVEIIDGDTIDVDIEGTIYRVRYIGMDTPEQGMPFFQEAAQANSDLVAGKTVILVKDVSETVQYNKLLRYVYLEDGRMVNAELVRRLLTRDGCRHSLIHFFWPKQPISIQDSSLLELHVRKYDG